jgi:hypothetical protein
LSFNLFHDFIELRSGAIWQRWGVMLRQDAAGLFLGSCSHIRCASRFPRAPGLVADQVRDQQLVLKVTARMFCGQESAPRPHFLDQVEG